MTNPTESDVDAADDTFPVSRATFQSIMDRLQRLDSEVSSLKPQVEGLHAENQALKHEIEELRGHKRETLTSGLSASAPRPGEPDFRLRSKSLSYASEPHSTPVREGTQLAGNVAGPSHANTIVAKSEATSHPGEVANSMDVIETVENTAPSDNESPPSRRASSRKRKAPAQADADWESPQPRPTKKVKGAKGGQTSQARRTVSTLISSKSEPSDTESNVSATPLKGEQGVAGGDITPAPSPLEAAPKVEASTSGPRTKFPAKQIKADSLKMDEKVANQLLTGVPTLKARPPPLKLQLPITLLQKEFGAATQGLLWHNTSKKGIKAGDIRRFIFPGFDTNPEMPAAPGEPGLLLCGRVEMLDGIWSLFTRVPLNDSSLKRWNYAGEYESEVVGKLTAQDFAGQPENVKRTWGKKIAHHKKHLPYVEMRARMALRKEGKAVTKASLKDEIGSIKKMPKDKSKLTAQDVIDAFESGQESIPIVRMQCVTYNHTFAEELRAKFKASQTSK